MTVGGIRDTDYVQSLPSVTLDNISTQQTWSATLDDIYIGDKSFTEEYSRNATYDKATFTFNFHYLGLPRVVYEYVVELF